MSPNQHKKVLSLFSDLFLGDKAVVAYTNILAGHLCQFPDPCEVFCYHSSDDESHRDAWLSAVLVVRLLTEFGYDPEESLERMARNKSQNRC